MTEFSSLRSASDRGGMVFTLACDRGKVWFVVSFIWPDKSGSYKPCRYQAFASVHQQITAGTLRPSDSLAGCVYLGSFLGTSLYSAEKTFGRINDGLVRFSGRGRLAARPCGSLANG
jgi:hypothetical protein